MEEPLFHQPQSGTSNIWQAGQYPWASSEVGLAGASSTSFRPTDSEGQRWPLHAHKAGERHVETAETSQDLERIAGWRQRSASPVKHAIRDNLSRWAVALAAMGASGSILQQPTGSAILRLFGLTSVRPSNSLVERMEMGIEARPLSSASWLKEFPHLSERAVARIQLAGGRLQGAKGYA